MFCRGNVRPNTCECREGYIQAGRKRISLIITLRLSIVNTFCSHFVCAWFSILIVLRSPSSWSSSLINMNQLIVTYFFFFLLLYIKHLNVGLWVLCLRYGTHSTNSASGRICGAVFKLGHDTFMISILIIISTIQI